MGPFIYMMSGIFLLNAQTIVNMLVKDNSKDKLFLFHGIGAPESVRLQSLFIPVAITGLALLASHWTAFKTTLTRAAWLRFLLGLIALGLSQGIFLGFDIVGAFWGLMIIISACFPLWFDNFQHHHEFTGRRRSYPVEHLQLLMDQVNFDIDKVMQFGLNLGLIAAAAMAILWQLADTKHDKSQKDLASLEIVIGWLYCTGGIYYWSLKPLFEIKRRVLRGMSSRN